MISQREASGQVCLPRLFAEEGTAGGFIGCGPGPSSLIHPTVCLLFSLGSPLAPRNLGTLMLGQSFLESEEERTEGRGSCY